MSLEVTVVTGQAQARQVRGLGAWLARSAPKSARGQVTVAVVADSRIRALNRRFRGKDAVTDVLSFPAEMRAKGKGQNSLPSMPSTLGSLGDIVIARGMAGRQARSLGHSLGTELRVLALHGLLHLLGYDHEMDEGQMARAEARLRRRAGLPAGLIARSS